ncbi:MAG: hypothetical protein KUG82_10950 [Pseudomonadales bacterium]|nr:hypothetical protein [Pseudomonadales bacterium]
MSASFMAIAIVLGLVALATLFYVSYNIERSKERKAYMMSDLSTKVRRFQGLIDCLPSNYMDGEVKAILLEEVILNLRQQRQLYPQEPRIARKLENAIRQKDEAKNSKTKIQINRIRNQDEANEIRSRLMDLFSCLQYFQKTRRHDPKTISVHLKTLQRLYVETNVAVHVTTAEEAAKRGKVKLALHEYQRSIAEYTRANTGDYTKEISDIKIKVAQLEKQSQADTEKNKAKEQEQGTELSRSMDAMQEQEDAQWKRKKF